MLSRTDILGMGARSGAAVEAPAAVTSGTDSRQEIYRRLSALLVGNQYEADVLSKLDDGSFLVRIADTTARMNLPQNTQVGDSVLMTKLASQPKPTFLVNADPGTGSSANLSAAGKMISAILQSAEPSEGSPTLDGGPPLIAEPQHLAEPESAPHLASTMAKTIQSSGLFYESHLQDWISGSRPLSAVLAEPQAKQAGNVQNTQSPQNPQNTPLPPGSQGHADLARLVSQAKSWTNGGGSLTELLRNAGAPPGAKIDPLPSSPSNDADTLLSSGGDTLAALGRESTQMIQHQLHVLEQRQVSWQGELWPGQPMRWEISEEPPEGNGSPTAETQSSWRSVVKFELPTLGTVSATIHLAGDRVQVAIDAASESTSSLLRQNRQSLATALEASGSVLNSFQVKKSDETP